MLWPVGSLNVTGHSPMCDDPSLLAGPGDPMLFAGPGIGCGDPVDPDEDEQNSCLFGGCEEESDNGSNDNGDDGGGNNNNDDETDHEDQSAGWKSSKPAKPKKPVCDAACQWRKKVEQRDEYKQKWDDYYHENPLPLPPGIDNPTCPRGNAMCQGTPGKPTGVISDQQDIDNEGLADRINAAASRSGDRVNGDVSEPSKRGFFDRVATGTGTRSTRHDPPGGNTPMTMEELWQFLKENKAELGHTGLDVLGLIPIIGEIADIANAAWYAAQGDFKMAGISAASAVPFLGWGGTGAKLGVKYGDEAIAAGRTAAGRCSFAGSTSVLMADGHRKAIENVEVGDQVIATDPQTGEQTAKKVEQAFVHHDTVVDLIVDGEVVKTTPDHPFWSVTDRRFERADDLSPGEKVLSADGTDVQITGIKPQTEHRALAYNLSIEGIHTYHVGGSDLLVHNNCIPWSAGSLRRVAGELERGATSVTVRNRSQAEELFLRLYQGRGYNNATGMSGRESREFFGTKKGSYHWDTEMTPGLPHSGSPHLQIHHPDGTVVRIFYGG